MDRIAFDATGGIDEDGCYADAGFTSLKHRRSHGAHVMDVFAGRIPTSSRIGPCLRADRRDPPSWKPGTDPASSADVVFVQFPENSIRDATGVWLLDYVVQGIQYILSFAEPHVTEQRGHQPQLRTDDRTARWHGGAGGGTDCACRAITTAPAGNPSSRSSSRRAMPI